MEKKNYSTPLMIASGALFGVGVNMLLFKGSVIGLVAMAVGLMPLIGYLKNKKASKS